MSSDQPIFLFNQEIFNAVSMATSKTSNVVDLSEAVGYALHASWTGTPTGTISVNGGNSTDVTTYVPVATNSTAGATGNYLLNVEKAMYRYLQVTYTASSSTGTLTAYISAKSI